ncbi:hypothetical protein NliqN6_4938 [Naganishia liquefaciens]|uniref:dolichol kinase n=1 Tax=Naganishia liquefaciens TaxID=104408 RepID=A0A8H3TX57_9TREE|nr:hypothetical protein NliqN6_4938 [Naganishia liquefaciens]
MRSQLPRNRSRSVRSSPSPSPPASPHLQPYQAGVLLPSESVIPSREKRRSFSTRQAIGSRPVPSRNPSSETRLVPQHAKPDEQKSRRRRESHHAPRTHRIPHSKAHPRIEAPIDSESITSPGGLRSRPSYSTHAEASVSSAGGFEDDDRFSSSDTEVGDARATYRLSPGAASLENDLDSFEGERCYSAVHNSHLLKASTTDLPSETSTTSRDISPRTRHLLLARNQSGPQSQPMDRSGSNESESDASRLSVGERWWEVVREVRRSASPFGTRLARTSQSITRSPLSSVFNFSTANAPSSGPSPTHALRKPTKTLPAILPTVIHLGDRPLVTITRRRAERGLLTGSVMLAVWRLYFDMGATTEVIELSVLSAIVIMYLSIRSIKTNENPANKHTGDLQLASNSEGSSMNGGSMKDGSTSADFLGVNPPSARNRRQPDINNIGRSSPLPGTVAARHDHGVARPITIIDTEDASIGSRGLVWATSDRDYRECIDDGAAFALLLGPLLAASMYYTSWESLVKNPTRTRTGEWAIETPRVLDWTPSPHTVFNGSVKMTDTLNQRHPAILALTALCMSRRHAVHLTCLLSLILIFHALWSRRQDLKAHRLESLIPGKEAVVGGSKWVKLSEWRRSWAIISFSSIVTAFVVGLKMAADYIGLTKEYDLTYPDIVIATLFFQFSLYVSVRLARRGFTVGELGIICHAATGLFMETVNLTRTRIHLLTMPYIKAYRLPTPLLILQLALIPGSLLCGFLLSPLLVLSRKIAQRPAHRLRHPQEKELYRKVLAAGFYLGAAAICGGLIGYWAKWLLGWRDPWAWVAFWLFEGRRWWTRPVLIAYWGLLAAISVAGWTRQLSRARKRKAWSAVTNSNGHSKISVQSSAVQAGLSHSQIHPKAAHATEPGFGHVATQMMDAANQKLPVLSINARRKFFHALATAMFVPGIIIDPAFTHLAFSLAFAAFNFTEYIRYFALYPFGAAVHLFLNEFLDESKDGGTAILSHFYLLTGCASGVWLEGPKTILSIFGALALGIGDALASIVGKRIGRMRWSSSSGKTVEGTIAFVVSVVFTACALMLTGCVGEFSIPLFTVMTTLVAMMEALSEQNDNLTLPIWGWCLGVLLRL